MNDFVGGKVGVLKSDFGVCFKLNVLERRRRGLVGCRC